MSDNEQYDPGVRLTVIAPKQWRDRPEMFLGPEPELPGSNRSHKGEDLTDNYLGP